MKLSLRKEKLTSLLNVKRKLDLNYNFKINEKELDIDVNIPNYPPKSLEDFFNLIEKFLKSNKIDEVKFGIFHSRNKLCSVEPNFEKFFEISFVDLILDINEKFNDKYIQVNIIFKLV